MKEQPLAIRGKIRLADFDPDYCGGLEKEKAKSKTDKFCQRIGELQDLLYANSRPRRVADLSGDGRQRQRWLRAQRLKAGQSTRRGDGQFQGPFGGGARARLPLAGAQGGAALRLHRRV